LKDVNADDILFGEITVFVIPREGVESNSYAKVVDIVFKM